MSLMYRTSTVSRWDVLQVGDAGHGSECDTLPACAEARRPHPSLDWHSPRDYLLPHPPGMLTTSPPHM